MKAISFCVHSTTASMNAVKVWKIIDIIRNHDDLFNNICNYGLMTFMSCFFTFYIAHFYLYHSGHASKLPIKKKEKTRSSDRKWFSLIYEPMFVFHFWAETIDHLPLPVLILIYYTSPIVVSPFRLFLTISTAFFINEKLFFEFLFLFFVFSAGSCCDTIFGDCTKN